MALLFFDWVMSQKRGEQHILNCKFKKVRELTYPKELIERPVNICVIRPYFLYSESKESQCGSFWKL